MFEDSFRLSELYSRPKKTLNGPDTTERPLT